MKKATEKKPAIKDNNTVELMSIEAKVKHMMVTIEGDGDLILNKMNARNERWLIEGRDTGVEERPNVWEDIITSIHWRDPIECENTYTDCNEEMLNELRTNNKPCITAFGLQQSFGDAIVRNEIAQYSTKLKNAINVVATGGLVPVDFGGWSIEKRLMSPKKGKPLTVHLNHLHNWKATFQVDYMDHVYSRDQILNIINLAGFGGGIGSGRSSGYGRYHISDVVACA